MFKKIRGRKSHREIIEGHNASHRWYAAAFDKEPMIQTVLPPKRDKIRRPVDGKPAHGTEHQEQSTVVAWWFRAHESYGLPLFALFAVPNGGARDIITGARLKKEGVRSGAYDLILAKPTKQYSGLFIEMKVGNNQPSDNQKAFGNYLNESGYKASVHWGATSAIAEIQQYLGQEP